MEMLMMGVPASWAFMIREILAVTVSTASTT